MRHQRLIAVVTCIALVAMLAWSNVAVAQTKGTISINVVLKTDATASVLADLGKHGTVQDVLAEVKAVTMQAKESELPLIQALPYVAAANPDAERKAVPVTTTVSGDFSTGISTWDLDAMNVTDYPARRTVSYDGSGVYVAVLDTCCFTRERGEICQNQCGYSIRPGRTDRPYVHAR